MLDIINNNIDMETVNSSFESELNMIDEIDNKINNIDKIEPNAVSNSIAKIKSQLVELIDKFNINTTNKLESILKLNVNNNININKIQKFIETDNNILLPPKIYNSLELHFKYLALDQLLSITDNISKYTPEEFNNIISYNIYPSYLNNIINYYKDKVLSNRVLETKAIVTLFTNKPTILIIGMDADYNVISPANKFTHTEDNLHKVDVNMKLDTIEYKERINSIIKLLNIFNLDYNIFLEVYVNAIRLELKELSILLLHNKKDINNIKSALKAFKEILKIKQREIDNINKLHNTFIELSKLLRNL